MAEDRFVRQEGELVTTKEDHNYSIPSERGKDGEVSVERQDGYLWPSTIGKWNDDGDYPNEDAAKDHIEEDSEERAAAAKSDDDGEQDDDRSSDDDADSDDHDGDSDDENGEKAESDNEDSDEKDD